LILSVFERHSANAFYRLMLALGAKVMREHADFRLTSRRAIKPGRPARQLGGFPVDLLKRPRLEAVHRGRERLLFEQRRPPHRPWRAREPMGFQDALHGLRHAHRLRPLRQVLPIREHPVEGFDKARRTPIGEAPEGFVESLQCGAVRAERRAQRRARVVALSDQGAQRRNSGLHCAQPRPGIGAERARPPDEAEIAPNVIVEHGLRPTVTPSSAKLAILLKSILGFAATAFVGGVVDDVRPEPEDGD
jgi:hypothetical protein